MRRPSVRIVMCVAHPTGVSEERRDRRRVGHLLGSPPARTPSRAQPESISTARRMAMAHPSSESPRSFRRRSTRSMLGSRANCAAAHRRAGGWARSASDKLAVVETSSVVLVARSGASVRAYAALLGKEGLIHRQLGDSASAYLCSGGRSSCTPPSRWLAPASSPPTWNGARRRSRRVPPAAAGTAPSIRRVSVEHGSRGGTAPGCRLVRRRVHHPYRGPSVKLVSERLH